MVSKSAVIGIDLGSADSYIGYVGKGIVDICQNEVSKRATPTLIGFTSRERLLGDAALAQIKSNAKNTCRNFKHLLGLKVDSPALEAEKFWSTCPIVEAADGYAGYSVMYKDQERIFSSVEATAMFLTKLREVTEKWTQSKVADCVIGVPSVFTDVHRQALLDAAKVAGMSVLRLMNEHTATALAYGIYRTNDFDEEKPLTVAFCSMGYSIFSVSVVQFVKGKLKVVCERSDKVGGRDMDECLMREFAAQFKKKVGCDPLSNKKASFKLEDAVVKCKKILSANSDAPINCECLMEDEDFASNIKRDDFLEMCQPMMAKVQAVLDAAISAMGMPVDQIDTVEVVGGATRVPWVKEMCSKAFGGKDLSTTMNADESVARGCALQAAILSPLYKVRDFKVEDNTNCSISIGWMGCATDAEAKEDDGDTQMNAAEGEFKTLPVFPAGSLMNTLKVLSFYRKAPFDIKAQYEDESQLIPGTQKALGNYKIELPAQAEAKKVKVRAKLTLHGTFSVEGAQMLEEEEYDETIKEKREVPPTPEEEAAAKAANEGAEGAEAPAADAPAEGEDGKADGEKKEEPKKAPEPKFEWVEVVKRKKRTKRTDLNIVSTGIPGLPPTECQKLMDQESAMQADMAEIIETDEKRNDLEAYIFTMRDKISDSGEYAAYATSADREAFSADLTKMEDWIYDTFDATKVIYIDKLNELKKKGDPIAWRCKEAGMRGEWVTALSNTISNYKNAAENPGETYGHIAPDKLAKIVQDCEAAAKWLAEMQAKQATIPKTDRPELLCADMEKKNQELAKNADVILKEPKPKPAEPPKEEKKEEPAKEASKEEEAKPEDDAAPKEEPKEGDGVMDVD